MSAYRRSRWVVFFHAPGVSLKALLSAHQDTTPATRTFAASALSGRETAVTDHELDVLRRLAADRWTPSEELGDDAPIVQRLAFRGLVVADDDTDPLAAMRNRDECLTREQWQPYAAVFHFMTREREGKAVTMEEADRLAAEVPAALAEVLDAWGTPPAEFHHRDRNASVPLPISDSAGGLYDALRARRTNRSFTDAPVSLDAFSTLLRYTFGCHGFWNYAPGLTALRKSAPSGGGLHPIEAYPIVMNADGVEPGVYHYDVRGHTLGLLTASRSDDLRKDLAQAFGGQEMVRTAAVGVILSVRFFRNFWKYRSDARAYAVLLLDAGHLSQTFQLVATDLGLGSFVSAAFDGPSVDSLIGVDGVAESALALVGCGYATAERSVLDADPVLFVPRQTVL